MPGLGFLILFGKLNSEKEVESLKNISLACSYYRWWIENLQIITCLFLCWILKCACSYTFLTIVLPFFFFLNKKINFQDFICSCHFSVWHVLISILFLIKHRGSAVARMLQLLNAVAIECSVTVPPTWCVTRDCMKSTIKFWKISYSLFPCIVVQWISHSWLDKYKMRVLLLFLSCCSRFNYGIWLKQNAVILLSLFGQKTGQN